MFRTKAMRTIDSAHSAIADAEMLYEHSFTPQAKAQALAELSSAQAFLARATEAKRLWDSTDHDDYEEYPTVPRNLEDNQGSLGL